MAAGERYKNGKPKDIVRHMLGNNMIEQSVGISRFKEWDGKTLCGRINVGYASDDKSDVTCIKCLNKLNPTPEQDK